MAGSLPAYTTYSPALCRHQTVINIRTYTNNIYTYKSHFWFTAGLTSTENINNTVNTSKLR